MKKTLLTAALIAATTGTAHASGPRECDIDPAVPCPIVSPVPVSDRDDSVFPAQIPAQDFQLSHVTSNSPQNFQAPAELPQTGPGSDLAMALTAFLAGFAWIGFKWYRLYKSRRAEIEADPLWAGNKAAK